VIRGHNLQDAKDELNESFPFRQEPQITISPSWWNFLPLIPFNILVEVK